MRAPPRATVVRVLLTANIGVLVVALGFSVAMLARIGDDAASSRPSQRTRVLGRQWIASPSPLPRPIIVSTPEPSVPSLPAAETAIERDPVSDRRSLIDQSCRNSGEQRCGRFYWSEPTEQDQRLQLDGFYGPHPTIVGEPITFTARASDPDAEVRCCSFILDGVRFGQDVERSCEDRYGPWDAPERRGSGETVTFEHVFEEPGTHEVIMVASSGDHCRHPYGGEATFTIWLTVEESGS